MAELDDDREGIEPEALDEDAGDPAAAFDALRRTIETQGAQIGAEMTVMRRGLEAAFDLGAGIVVLPAAKLPALAL